MCSRLGVSRSGFYAWRDRPPSTRDRADTELVGVIRAIHTRSRGTYGAPRVHAELGLEFGIRCGRKRVARLMRRAHLQGVRRRRPRVLTVQDPKATPAPDLVNRDFDRAEPNRLWVADITQHRAWQGWLYLAVVLSAYSRRALRAVGAIGSMGSVGHAYDDAPVESFFATLQTELLDRHYWSRRAQLEMAIFDYIEAFYNPRRRHSSLGQLSPANYEKMT